MQSPEAQPPTTRKRTNPERRFNLRDLSKVFQGITKAAGSVEDHPTLIRLWVHETLRVFYDR